MPLGASLLTGLLFGIVPALHAARRDSGATPARKAAAPASDGVRGRRRAAPHSAIGELAVALVLLIGAGLLVRSVVALNSQDPGFASTGVLTLRLDLPPASDTTPPSASPAFYDQLIERLSALPGVEAAGAGSSLLLSRLPGSATHQHRGAAAAPGDAQNIPVPYDCGHVRATSPRLQIPLRRGRMFTPADTPECAGCRARQRIVRHAGSSRTRTRSGRRVTFGESDAGRTPGGRRSSESLPTPGAAGSSGSRGRRPTSRCQQGPDPRMFVFINNRPGFLLCSAALHRRPCGRSIATRPLPASARCAICSRRRRRIGDSRRCCSASLPLSRWCSRPSALRRPRLQRYRTAAHAGNRHPAWRWARTVPRFCAWCSPAARKIAAIGLGIGIAGALALTQVLSGLLFGVSPRDPLTFLVVPAGLPRRARRLLNPGAPRRPRRAGDRVEGVPRKCQSTRASRNAPSRRSGRCGSRARSWSGRRSAR